MQNLELNISEIIDSMSKEIASLIKQVYIKDAEIKALRLHIAGLNEDIEEPAERPEVTA